MKVALIAICQAGAYCRNEQLNILTLGAMLEGQVDYDIYHLQNLVRNYDPHNLTPNFDPENIKPQNFARNFGFQKPAPYFHRQDPVQSSGLEKILVEYDTFVLTGRGLFVLEWAKSFKKLKNNKCTIVFFHEYFQFFMPYYPEFFDYVLEGANFRVLADFLIEKATLFPQQTDKKYKKIADLSLFSMPPLPYEKYPGHTIFRESALRNMENMDGPETALSYYSLGCPHNCAFCINPVFFHGQVDFRDPNCLIQEFAYFKSLGINSFSFEDADFLLDISRLEALFELMKEKSININFRCHGRGDRLDDKACALLKKMGCFRVDIGLESGSLKMLEQIDKKIRPHIIEKAVENCKKHGIWPFILAILGMPGESEEDRDLTGAFLSKLKGENIRYGLGFYRPMPGTRLYDEIKSQLSNFDPGHDDIHKLNFLPQGANIQQLLDFYFSHTGIKPSLGTGLLENEKEKHLPELQKSGDKYQLNLMPENWSRGFFQPIKINLWSGDEWCKSGWAHLVGRFKGFVEYDFISPQMIALEIRISFYGSTQNSDYGQIIVSVNGAISHCPIKEKKEGGEFSSVILKMVPLKNHNIIRFQCDNEHGLSIMGQSLDGRDNRFIRLNIIPFVPIDGRKKID